MTRIPIYLVETEVGGGLPPERRYGLSLLGSLRKVGEIGRDDPSFRCDHGSYMRAAKLIWGYGVGTFILTPAEGIRAAIEGRNGLSWHPLDAGEGRGGDDAGATPRDPLAELGAWLAAHKNRSVDISHGDGYGASCGWAVTLFVGKVPASTYESQLSEDNWMGLGATILAAIGKGGHGDGDE